MQTSTSQQSVPKPTLHLPLTPAAKSAADRALYEAVRAGLACRVPVY